MKRLTRTVLAFLMTAPLVVSLSFTLDDPGLATGEIITSAHADRGGGGRGGDGMLGGTIWGNIKRYTDSYIVVNGRTYPFHKNVVIDTFSLRKDDRGNVRIVLDEQGKVLYVFFYGIDMPDVIRRYKM